MSERRLDQMDGRVVVERVAGMGVAHPVGRDPRLQPGLRGSGVDDAPDLGGIEGTARFAAAEDRIVDRGRSPKGQEFLPESGLQQNVPGFAAFAEDRDLAAILARREVGPLESAEFGHADSGDIQEFEKNSVSARGSGFEEGEDLGFGKDALRQGVAIGAEPDGGAGIEGQIAGLLCEREQGFQRRKRAVLAGGFQIALGEGGGPGLQVGQGHRGERLADEREETGGIGGVGAAGVGAGFEGEPEIEELGIAGCRGGRYDVFHVKQDSTICFVIVYNGPICNDRCKTSSTRIR